MANEKVLGLELKGFRVEGCKSENEKLSSLVVTRNDNQNMKNMNIAFVVELIKFCLIYVLVTYSGEVKIKEK
jgi:hypothetical protein